MEPTTERLAKALEETNNPALKALIPKARAGEYDDYKSPHADPINRLVADLNIAGASDLAARAMAGEFDGTAEEATAWAQSAEGRALFAEFLGHEI